MTVKLADVSAVEMLREAQYDLEHVIRYGLSRIDHFDAEKILQAAALIRLLIDAQKGAAQ